MKKNLFFIKNNFIKREVVLLILLLFFVNFIFSQNSSQLIGSLKHKLENVNLPSDSSKVKLLNDISFEYIRVNTDSSIFFANKALKIAQEINFEKGLAESYNMLGISYSIKGDFPNSLINYNESLAFYTKLGNEQGRAMLLNSLGYFYFEQKKPEEAIKYINEALKINEEMHYEEALSYNYLTLGNIYSEEKNFEKARSFFSKSLILKSKLNDEVGMCSVFFSMANDYCLSKEYCSAFTSALRANEICKKLQYPYDIARSYETLGQIYFKSAIDSVSSNKCNQFLLSKKEKFLVANNYLQKALPLFLKVNDLLSVSNTYEVLAEVNENLGNSKLALANYKMFTQLKDSIFTIENNIVIANTEKQNEVNLRNEQLKEHELLVHRKQDQLFFLIGFILIGALLVSSFVYFQFKKQKVEHILNKQLASKNLELVKANATKDKFFSIISHDLRSPFNSLIGLSDLLVTNFDNYEEEKIKKFVKAIHNTSVETHKLLENLLQWSKIQRDTIEPNFEIINLNEITNSVFSMLYNSAETKNIVLENNIEKDMNVYCDLEMTKTILRNLISNAIKFTANGAIIIDAKVKDTFIEIRVEDTGVGIPSNRLNKLFNIDEDYTTLGTENEKGTGLGLPICKELVEKQGGKIMATSQLGKGSIFIVELPNKG